MVEDVLVDESLIGLTVVEEKDLGNGDVEITTITYEQNPDDTDDYE